MSLTRGFTSAHFPMMASVEKPIAEAYKGSVMNAFTGTAITARAIVDATIEIAAPFLVLIFL